MCHAVYNTLPQLLPRAQPRAWQAEAAQCTLGANAFSVF